MIIMGDDEFIRKTVTTNQQGRCFLENAFRERGWQYVPSSGNFVMLNVKDARKVFDQLMRHGVIVRPLHGYRLPEWIRITVGTTAENEKFLRMLDEVCKKG